LRGLVRCLNLNSLANGYVFRGQPSLQNRSAFFTDRCSGDEYFISLNSKERRLKRTSGNPQKPPYFAGTFEGDGLKVVVKSLHLISKTYEKGSKRTEADVEDAAYKVSVTVKHGRRVEEINGVLSYGR
jgi:hypothetical protein